MYDNICSVPLSSDLIALAIHPTATALSVGLSAGHVETYRLPSEVDPGSSLLSAKPNLKPQTARSSASPQDNKKPTIRSKSRLPSQNGLGTIENSWRTRRHKGSCRDLAYSPDGASLYSAGTDGIVKAASAETGRVFSKVVVSTSPAENTPSLISAISSQTLLLATDAGAVYLYDLRDGAISSGPQKSLYPHKTKDDPDVSEPITSLTLLPPSDESTSGTPRQFVTTSGSTVAACDLRKGVLGTSFDQGDVVTSSACLLPFAAAPPPIASKRRHGESGAGPVSGTFLVGGTSGSITLWERGQYEDRLGSIVLDSSPLQTADGEDGGVDSIASLPLKCRANVARHGRSHVVAAGLDNGAIRFVEVRGKGGKVMSEVRHDEMGVEGVTALGFDVLGRMVSGGGEIVKVWHEVREGEDGEEERKEEAMANGKNSDDDSDASSSDSGARDEAGGEENDDVDSDSDGDDSPPRAKRQKKGQKRNQRGGWNHGITSISGLV